MDSYFQTSFFLGELGTIFAIFMEGCPSGLRSPLGKRVYTKVYRGFESHPLHHFLSPKSVYD